jgi:hypothetical protein
MEMSSDECTETSLHQLIIPFFDYKAISQLRSHTSLRGGTHISRRVQMPVKNFNISPLWIMFTKNLVQQSPNMLKLTA